jgi:predicted branched-subunit amino acid permease
VAAATLWELILTQLIINSRYALMSLALSQRMGQRIGFLPRLAIAFFNTDEIFALAMAREVPLTVPFMLGLGTLPILGWTLGTLCGALAGSILPVSIQAALGVMLYGMFIAIVVPPARKEKEVLVTVILAMVLSTLFTVVPLLKQVSAGISIVICTVAAAAVCAALFPIPEEER